MIAAVIAKVQELGAGRLKMGLIPILTLTAVFLISAACGPSEEDSSPSPTPTPTSTPGTTPNPTATPPPPGAGSDSEPVWLKELASRLEKEPVANPPASITQYDYKGRTVYFLPQRCCDVMSILYDSEGNIIGHPDGGITGQGDGKVPDFFEQRSNEKLLWADQRTGEPAVKVVDAPIESVRIEVPGFGAGNGSLSVVSGLPDSCESFGDHSVSRRGDTFNVEITNLRKTGTDLACDELYRTVTTTIPLPGEVEACEVYEVEVNREAYPLQAIAPNVKCERPTDPSVDGVDPKDALCIPSGPLGVVEGDTWSLAGPIVVKGDFPNGFPQGAASQSATFAVTAIEGGKWRPPGITEDTAVENSRIRVDVLRVTLDVAGNVLKTDDEDTYIFATTDVLGQAPVLTLDWECHRRAWVEGWSEPDHASVGETTLSSGETLVLFSVKQPVKLPEQAEDDEAVGERVFGYEKRTGRILFQEFNLAGTLNGEPFEIRVSMQLQTGDTTNTGGQTRPDIQKWLAQLIESLENEPVANPPASITQYDYEGRTVYFLPQRCCDIWSVLFDSEGIVIGHPDGGITGEGDGKAPDFFEERKNEALIWADTRGHDPSLVRRLAPIESLDILVKESFPLQYDLVVASGLPDSCASFAGHDLSREGTTVRVNVWNLRNADPNLACAQVYRTVETRIPLGSDFDPDTTYTVDANGKTISFEGDSVIKSAISKGTNPGLSSLTQCGEDLGLVISIGGAEKYPVVTSYRCGSGYIDSTGLSPTRAPSLVLSKGESIDFKLLASNQPTDVELRLYSEAGISGWFLMWPEERPTKREAVDRFQPTSSQTFQYRPQVPAGEYSLVIRAFWEKDIDVYYALSFEVK